MRLAIARIGDTCDHGGAISTGSDTVLVDGIGVARIGDTLNCDIHGPVPIVSGSSTVLADGFGVARVGDAAFCGALIQTGSDDVEAG